MQVRQLKKGTTSIKEQASQENKTVARRCLFFKI